LAITSEAMSEHQSRFAEPALKVAQSTQFASRHAIRSFTYLALRSPVFAVRFMAQATALACELLEQQIVYTKQLTNILVEPPRKVTPVAPKTPFARTGDDVAQAAARKTIAQAAKMLASAGDDSVSCGARKVIDEDAQAIVRATDGALPALITTTDDDQQIQLQAERFAINKQSLKNGQTRVRNEIVTEMRPIELPASHGELINERNAVASDVDVAKEAIVKEIVGSAKRRVADVENVSDIVRHQELRVDDPTTIPATSQGVIHEKRVTTADDAVPALVPNSGSTIASAEHEQASVNERVRERAYALWEAEGRPEGRPLEYWTRAEREIYAMPTPATAI
jgi:hypothetical protein